MIAYLLSRSSTNRFRGVILEWDEQWHEEEKAHIIKRTSYQYHGKRTQQPNILITVGKAGRSHREQATLEYKSNLKKYLDKGYREVDKDIDLYTEEELNSIYGEFKTDTTGILKPMLAKQYQDVSTSAFKKNYYASKKINGVRCLIYYKDGELYTRSRGSITYDLAISHIINNERLLNWFKKHPTIILDGEIYKFGMTLNRISGICRTQKTASDGKDLEYYLYDIVDTNLEFKDRLTILNQLKEDLELDFNPEKEWKEGELQMQFVPQIPITGWDNMKKLHDKYVSEGWEGLVIRLVNGTYHPGTRGAYMIKIKEYFEKEYKIVGLSEGLREEDMCFVLETESGLTFNAKPIGDRALKQEYRERLNEIIGKMATIKYFEMSGTGSDIPQQPIMLGIRDYE